MTLFFIIIGILAVIYYIDIMMDYGLSLAGPFMIITGLFLFISGILFLSSIEEYGRTTSYIESGAWKTYPKLVQAQIDAGVIGDLSNSTTGPQLIDNLQSWYNDIQIINREIISAKTMNSRWYTDMFVYDWPEYPELINADSIQNVMICFDKTVTNINSAAIVVSK